MLSYFPTPYPDENLYSILARYHAASANTSYKATLRQLFGTESVIPDAALPSHLDALCQQLPTNHRLTPVHVIKANTLYTYFIAFQGVDTRRWLQRAMRGNDGRSIQVKIGAVAGHLVTNERSRFCRTCARDDLRDVGEPYWHRMHQLPGTLVCPEHGQALTYPVGKQRQELVLPAILSNQLASYGFDRNVDPVVQRRLLEIARLNQKLLSNGPLPIDATAAMRAYRHALLERGLISDGGRVRQASFRLALADYYANPPIDFISSLGVTMNWAAEMIAGDRIVRNPLKHVLLIHYLFGTLEAFLDACYKSPPNPQAFGTPPVPYPSCAVLKRMLVTDGLSARQTSGRLRVSVTTVLQHAKRCGLHVQSRPKYANTISERILTDAIQRPDPVKVLARRNKVSVTYVYRLLFANPEIRDRYRDLLLSSEIRERRKRLECWLQRNPAAAVTALRNMRSADFIYLYRHDRKWLTARLSTQPRGLRRKHDAVDWVTRDRNFANEIQQTLRELRQNNPTLRITISRIGCRLHRQSWIDKHLDKLPKSRELLNSLKKPNK